MTKAIVEISAKDSTSKALSSIDQRFGKLEKSVNSLTGKFGKMGGALVSLAGAAGFGALTNELLGTADRIGKVSAQVGVSTTQLQEFQFAASQSGVSTEGLNKSLQGLSRRAGDALEGNKKLSEQFASLGVSLTDATGKALGTGEIFSQVATGIQNLSSDAEKAAAANALFGKSGVELLPLLNSGAQGIQDYANKLQEAGGVMSEDFIKNSEATNDVIDTVSRTLKASFANAMSALLPAIQSGAELFGKLATGVAEFAAANPLLTKSVTTIGALAVSVGILSPLLMGLAGALGAISLPVTLTIAGITALVVAYNHFSEEISAGIQILKDVFVDLGLFLLSPIRKALEGIGNLLNAAPDWLVPEGLKKGVDSMVKALTPVSGEATAEGIEKTKEKVSQLAVETNKLKAVEAERFAKVELQKPKTKNLNKELDTLLKNTTLNEGAIKNLNSKEGLGGVHESFVIMLIDIQQALQFYHPEIVGDFRLILEGMLNWMFYHKQRILEQFDGMVQAIVVKFHKALSAMEERVKNIQLDITTKITKKASELLDIDGKVTKTASDLISIEANSQKSLKAADLVTIQGGTEIKLTHNLGPDGPVQKAITELGNTFKAMLDSLDFKTVISDNDGNILKELHYNTFKLKEGGLINGPLHASGGIKFGAGGRYEMEGGEYIMSRKAVSRIGVDQLDNLNHGYGSSTGGVNVIVYADLEGRVKLPIEQMRVKINEQARRNQLPLAV